VSIARVPAAAFSAAPVCYRHDRRAAAVTRVAWWRRLRVAGCGRPVVLQGGRAYVSRRQLTTEVRGGWGGSMVAAAAACRLPAAWLAAWLVLADPQGPVRAGGCLLVADPPARAGDW
jgi:hypothetical protein